MNKLLKGAVTGAAGIALLAGGAGTFAAWNSSTAIAAGPVNTGTLSVAAVPSSATWTDITNGTPGTPLTSGLTNYLFVPGDTVQLTENVTISATGNNLTAALTALAPTQTDTGTGTAANDFTIATSFGAVTGATNGASLKVNTTGTGASAATTYTVSAGAAGTGTITVPVTVDISLPASEANSTQSATVNLTSIGIDLTQSTPTAATPAA